MNFIKRLWLRIVSSNDKPYIDAIDDLKKRINELVLDLDIYYKENLVLSKRYAEINIKLGEAINKLELLENTKTPLEEYLSKKYKKIVKIAYKQKRYIKDADVTISLHELVTPDSWEVHNFFKRIDTQTGNIKDIAKRVGDRVASRITWTSDFNLATSGDYYLYPNETIALEKGDCEDHAFIVMSANKNLGGAWGFFKEGGHAFNVFLYENELYVLDTVSNISYIKKLSEAKDYKINYIITEKYAFVLDGSVTFGILAGWN